MERWSSEDLVQGLALSEHRMLQEAPPTPSFSMQAAHYNHPRGTF